VQTTPDIGLSGAVCTPGVTSSQMVRSSSENDTGRRPNFPPEFKRKVVEATFQSGASVSLIAREHDVNANLVFRWRQQYQEGLFARSARVQRFCLSR